MMTMFQVCFFVGIGLTILSFIFGNLFEFIGVDGIDLDLGIDLWLPINPILYMMFATVFGGVGIILLKRDQPFSSVIILGIAFSSAFTVSGIVNQFIIKPLKRAQNTSTAEQEELIGIQANVTESIKLNGFGEITYVYKGNTYTSPAKATTEASIEKGSKVAICWIEEHVFYVSNIDL